MFPHFLKRLRTKAEVGYHVGIQPIPPVFLWSLPHLRLTLLPFAFLQTFRFRRGFRNRVRQPLNSLWLTVKMVQVTVKMTPEPCLWGSKLIQDFWNLCAVAGSLCPALYLSVNWDASHSVILASDVLYFEKVLKPVTIL